MLVTSRVIVLRAIKYNDDSIIADTFAEKEGMVGFIVRISRVRNPVVRHTLFHPLALLDISWDDRARPALRRPKAAQVADPLRTITSDPSKTAIALFMAEFLQAALSSGDAGKELFQYVYSSIQWLDASGRGFANFHLVFLIHLTRFLGFAPNMEGKTEGGWFDLLSGQFTLQRPLHSHALTPAEAARLPLLMRMDYATMHLFKFSGRERSELLAHIIEYYRLHVADFPELKSPEVLKDLFRA